MKRVDLAKNRLLVSSGSRSRNEEAEVGMPVQELCRKHGFSDASFYKWRPGWGMDVSEARRLRELEGENAKLKKLLA